MEKDKKTIILGVTASIAAYKSLDLVSRFKRSGYNVVVVMTKDSLNFVGALSFQALSGNNVHTDLFCSPRGYNAEHISLSQQADLILVCPASCNILAKVAGGLCDDLLSAIICATDSSVVFAPAMNDKMFNNKITQDNIEKLKSLKYGFIGPAIGRLACSRDGVGRLENINLIEAEVKKILG
ncbi:MAG: flavoprotein [Candidatus Gygaella obscura]|nr:flavoprotein [Candidatus Gygaella obscura]